MFDQMPILVYVGLAVLTLLFFMAVLAKLFRKAGPHEALIVYGFRGTRVVKGGGTIIYPMIEQCRELSLELMSFDVAPQQDLYTQAGRRGHGGGSRADQSEVRPGIDPDRGRAVSDQAAGAARRPDPPRDGRPSARHHRPAHGGSKS